VAEKYLSLKYKITKIIEYFGAMLMLIVSQNINHLIMWIIIFFGIVLLIVYGWIVYEESKIF
jgi:hypothetical protein